MEAATTAEVRSLDQLLADVAGLKRPEILEALGEEFPQFDTSDLGSSSVGDLRAVLATLRLSRQKTPPEAPEAEEDAQAAVEEPVEAVEVPSVEEVAGTIEDEVGKAMALREETPQPQSALPTPAEFNASLQIAETIALTSFVPQAYRGRAPDVLAAILFGREIGLGPMVALRDVFMVDGRPVLAAHRQLALLRKGGVVILESETTRERAFIRAQRGDTGEIMAVEFTYEEAEQIKRKGKPLVDGDNWRNYPADMLWARCVGRLTRRLGSDLLNGLPPYVAEEVADFSGWGVEYNQGGEIGLRPAQNGPVRHEAAGRTETPRSWAEIHAWAEPYGPEIAWKEWVRDASQWLFETPDATALTGQQKTILGQKASGAIVALRDAHDPSVFPPPTRKEIQAAWASVLEGEILEGPQWRLSPEETYLPTYWEANDLEPPAQPTAPAADEQERETETAAAEVIEDGEWTPTPEEDIPFGDDGTGYGN